MKKVMRTSHSSEIQDQELMCFSILLCIQSSSNLIPP